IDREDFRRFINNLWLCGSQDWIAVDHPPALCVGKHYTNVCSVIRPALWSAIEIAQPVVQFFDSDRGNWPFPKISAECRETLFQISNVCRAHPVLALRFHHLFRQFLDSDIASADSLQVVQVKGRC